MEEERVIAIETQVTPKELKEIVTGRTNPLHDISPPEHTIKVESAVLLQAADIKETLERIFRSDPTARSHSFPYIIMEPNRQLLENHGFKLRTYTRDPGDLDIFTEVSWDNENKVEFVVLT